MSSSLNADQHHTTDDGGLTKTLVVHTPAKLNVSLRVLGKRADGFHELESHFLAVSLYDTLEMQQRTDGQIRLELFGAGRDVQADESNLVMRAARLLEKTSKTSTGVSLRLTKRIPSQAGLGGGSSDAAAALIGLNSLWNLRRTDAEMHELAAQLGSDLNFFVAKTAVGLASGRGEHITPLPLPQTFSVVIAKPPFGASTGRVFEQLRIPTGNRGESQQQLKNVQNVLSGRVAPHNDLQSALEAVEPRFQRWFAELDRKTRLSETVKFGQKAHARCDEPTDGDNTDSDHNRRGSVPVWTLTGSGTAVYQFVRTPHVAATLAAHVRAALPESQVFVAGPGRLSIQRRLNAKWA